MVVDLWKRDTTWRFCTLPKPKKQQQIHFISLTSQGFIFYYDIFDLSHPFAWKQAMTTSFPRLLSTTASNPTLFRTGSDHLTRSVSNSVTRLLFSSSSSTHHHNEKEQTQTPKPESLHDDDKQSQKEEEEEEEDNDDDIDMNKETGEVGGPKGPEPTRYGDWERNGRCSDFWFIAYYFTITNTIT